MSLEHFPAKGACRLRRAEASAYLKQTWGLSYGARTLAKLATIGGGPPMEYAGRIPLYPVEDGLDAWARQDRASGQQHVRTARSSTLPRSRLSLTQPPAQRVDRRRVGIGRSRSPYIADPFARRHS